MEKNKQYCDEKTIGPKPPSEYKIKGIVNGEYGKVEDEQPIDMSDTEDQTQSRNLTALIIMLMYILISTFVQEWGGDWNLVKEHDG